LEEAERIITADSLNEDSEFSGLRPKKLANFIGQEKLKENLRIHMEAASSRGEVLEHILFYGPPGLGRPRLQMSSPTRWGWG